MQTIAVPEDQFFKLREHSSRFVLLARMADSSAQAAWNASGLIRQYLPKGTDRSRFRQGEFIHIANLRNHRPRKILDQQTPREMSSQLLADTQRNRLATNLRMTVALQSRHQYLLLGSRLAVGRDSIERTAGSGRN